MPASPSSPTVGNVLRSFKFLSDVTDQMVEKHADSLVNVTVLDISNCLKITCKGLEAFGKHCKSLIHLKRNMPPLAWETPIKMVASKIDDREAVIIAGTMMRLHHLELGYGRFGDHGVDAILTKRKALTHLDIQGCWGVELEGDLEDKCEQLVFFKSPWFDDYDNRSSSDNDSSGIDAGEKSSSSDLD